MLHTKYNIDIYITEVEYQLPYADCVKNNLFFAEMEIVVAKQKIRPSVEVL